MVAGNEAVAVLGAGGTMGFAMARNLARGGIEVRAWNRSPDKAEPLAEDGATIARTPAEAADGADVVLTMLSDTDAVLDATGGDDGALSAASEATLWLQMSTLGVAGTERCMKLAAEREVDFVDAPVLGTKQPAEEGQLIVMASGQDELRGRVAPILEIVGKKTMWLGEAGKGSALKVVTNSWLVTVVEGAAETIALAEAAGVDPQDFLDAIEGGPLDMPYLELKAKAMIGRNFEPSFRLALASKDAGLVSEAADRAGIELPVLAAIRERMQQGVQAHGDKDLSATFLTSVRA